MIFTISSFFPYSNLDELEKSTDLIKHYTYHKVQSNGRIDFLTFVKMHYADTKHQKSENHCKLPLHSDSHTTFSSLIFHEIVEADFFLNDYVREFPNIRNVHVYPSPSIAIWQPPKIS